MNKAELQSKAEDLYEVRRKISILKEKEEKLGKLIKKYEPQGIKVKTPEGYKTMMIVTDEKIVLKDNETISQKVGAQKFYELAKVGVGDLRSFCEKEGYKFKWFVKKTEEGATKIIFT